MRFIKKTLSLILIFSLILGVFSIISAQAAEQPLDIKISTNISPTCLLINAIDCLLFPARTIINNVNAALRNIDRPPEYRLNNTIKIATMIIYHLGHFK